MSFEIANLIAAGEVVERPSSVMKELIENSIDSGATSIVAEIKHGGVSLIRVSDNGCGIDREDLPVALKRHATSKISEKDDLEHIMTLGFRGEALAAISSVSKVTIITKTSTSDSGYMLTSEGGTVNDISEVGSADGTTVVVENLFYNVPARRKFLKKDSTEAMNVAALIEKVALSRPDISIQFLVDGEERFKTPGDSKLISAIYSVYGRAFADKMIEVKGEAGGIKVSGYVGRSDNARKNRNAENIFINGRYVKSLTAMAALEKAYTSFIAPGYFPVAALMIEMSPEIVDVNVHPAKLEVKFSNEQAVFEAVYYTVKCALEEYEYRPELTLEKREEKKPLQSYQMPIRTSESPAPKPTYSKPREDITVSVASRSKGDPFGERESVSPRRSLDILEKYRAAQSESTEQKINLEKSQEKIETPTPVSQNTPEYKYIGEAFNCYVIIEYQGDMLIIDKHAAHERIIFEDLKQRRELDGRIPSQALMLPILVTLSPTELAALDEFRREVESTGFAFTVCDGYAELTSIPEAISASGAEELFASMASELSSGETNPAVTEHIRKEKALYQVACKAAIKGGRVYDRALIDWLVGKLLLLPDITVCPHGRPVAFKLTKAELDRKFDRIK